MKIDGKAIADKILGELKDKVQKLKQKGIIPHLVIIQIGNDPASTSYINQKELRAAEVGVKVSVVNYESGIKNHELLEEIKRLNKDYQVHGIIIQRPVPPQIDLIELNSAIDPKKDVDGFHPNSKFDPPIAQAVLKVLEKTESERHLTSLKIAIIGKGQTGGMPVIKMFRKLGIEPTVISSKTLDPLPSTLNADIIISAVGKPNVLSSSNIKEGSVLIGIGLHKEEDGKLHGDYNEHEIEQKAKFYTPTPGGIGPVNVACLLQNLVDSAKKNSLNSSYYG